MTHTTESREVRTSLPSQTLASNHARSAAVEIVPSASLCSQTDIAHRAATHLPTERSDVVTASTHLPDSSFVVKQEDDQLFLRQQFSEPRDHSDVHIVARIHLKKTAPSGLVYNQDGAKLAVQRSFLLPEQDGLFVLGFAAVGTWMTWYTGRNYDSYASLIRTEAIGSPFLLDVEASGLNGTRPKILYYIDGAQPNSQFGGTTRCLATFVNHSRNQPNCQFQVTHVKGIYRGCGVVLVATRSISAGEELLADYGDRYHQQLLQSGQLRDHSSALGIHSEPIGNMIDVASTQR